MAVQTGHFLEDRGDNAAAKITFHGQEKSDTNTNLAKMNLAVHGLEGKIRQGNTFYDRWEELIGKCNYVMSNPPFNVDGVSPDKVKSDPRLFTEKKIPGIAAKTKAVSNANYLWIQYFYSYLNATGRENLTKKQLLVNKNQVGCVVLDASKLVYPIVLFYHLFYFITSNNLKL